MKRLTVMAGVALAAGVSAAVLAHGVDVPSSSKNLQFFDNAQSQPISSMNEPGVKAYFEDIVSSADPTAPISCGMFKIEKGNPLVYTYDYDDIKLVVDGQITFSDGEQEVTANKGDVLFFPKGATITFSSDDVGQAFACGQRNLF